MRKKSLYLFLSWLVAAFLIFGWHVSCVEAQKTKTGQHGPKPAWIGATGNLEHGQQLEL
jgi:hypothetical protein